MHLAGALLLADYSSITQSLSFRQCPSPQSINIGEVKAKSVRQSFALKKFKHESVVKIKNQYAAILKTSELFSNSVYCIALSNLERLSL